MTQNLYKVMFQDYKPVSQEWSIRRSVFVVAENLIEAYRKINESDGVRELKIKEVTLVAEQGEYPDCEVCLFL
jgi:hypothetical protein